MPAVPEMLELAGEFPAPTPEQWRVLVARVLQRSGLAEDRDPVDALSSTTYDGIRLVPLYAAEDAPSTDIGLPGSALFVRGATVDGATATGWDVRQRHADPDPARARAAVLADLECGATSLWLVLGEAGLSVAELAAVLDGVYVDLAPIALDAGAQTSDAASAFLDLVLARELAHDEIAGTLGADPIGLRARAGVEADLSLLGRLAERAKAFPNLRVATVDATVYHDAGGSDADELAVATSVGVAYLRALTDAGLSVDAALDAVEFRFALTSDQFASIAKLRAARRMWARVAELSGAADARRGQRQHAVTSAAMMTRRDPWVNMLRTTLACFAAAVGGADAITVLPFDAALGLPDDFARRIARNTQAVLHDESSLGRVIDAAGGSWYVESRTEQLASIAWESFTAIERAGGALAALDAGLIGDQLAVARAARAEDIAHRRAPITGVSEYPLPSEPAVVRVAAPAAPSGGALPSLRYAQDFEQLRDRADAADQRPRVFLAALGPLAAHSARVGFATNLFQAAGIEVVVGSGDDPEDIVRAFLECGTTLACLCSSNRVYSELARSVATALRTAGARYLWLAGSPDTAQQADIDGYVFAGCNALQVLRTALEVLEVPA